MANFLSLTITLYPFLLLQLLLLLLLPSGTDLFASATTPTQHQAQCKFPEYLQTSRNKHWMMKNHNTLTTFDVDGGKIFARYGSCDRPRDYNHRRPNGAECVRSNYTRLCMEVRGNKYLARHMESDFNDKFVCMEFIQRGINVVQVKT
jgi:hypothetical protein